MTARSKTQKQAAEASPPAPPEKPEAAEASPAEASPSAPPEKPEAAEHPLTSALGVSRDDAELLATSGFTDVESIAALSVSALDAALRDARLREAALIIRDRGLVARALEFVRPRSSSPKVRPARRT